MFRPKSNKPSNKPAKIETFISEGTEIRGDLIFIGGLHLDGKVIGNVISEGENTAVLTVGHKGQIEGEVRVPDIILNGQVTGDVYTTERIELSGKARVKGNVYYRVLEMAAGAEVNGSLVHCETPEKIKPEQTKGKPPTKNEDEPENDNVKKLSTKS